MQFYQLVLTIRGLVHGEAETPTVVNRVIVFADDSVLCNQICGTGLQTEPGFYVVQ